MKKIALTIAIASAIGIANADSVLFHLNVGDRFQVRCAGKIGTPRIVQKSWIVPCEAEDQPPPGNGDKPPPQAECPTPDPRLGPVSKFVGIEMHVPLAPGQSSALSFNSNEVKGKRVRISVGPHFAGTRAQSKLTTWSVTKCAGNLNVNPNRHKNRVDDKCWATAGPIATIDVSLKGEGSNADCKLDPGVEYFITASPIQPATWRPTCNQACGIVINKK